MDNTQKQNLYMMVREVWTNQAGQLVEAFKEHPTCEAMVSKRAIAVHWNEVVHGGDYVVLRMAGGGYVKGYVTQIGIEPSNGMFMRAIARNAVVMHPAAEIVGRCHTRKTLFRFRLSNQISVVGK